MEHFTNDRKELLIDRITDNYYNFKFSLNGVSREKLFDMAGRIAAVMETYEMLTTQYDWDEAEEVEFYLLFRDPLTIIADAWENHRKETTEDFENILFGVAYSDNILSEYPLTDGVDARLYGNIISFPC
jgi:hypothetical protein